MADPTELLASSRPADWRKAAKTILATANPRVAFAPFLKPQAIVDEVSVQRATVIVEAMHAALEKPEGSSMLVPPLLSRKLRARRDAESWATSGAAFVETIFAFLARKGWEGLAQYAIDVDVDDETLAALFARMPDKKAASEAVRKQSVMSTATKEAKARAVIAHAALGKKPRAVSTLRLTSGPGTDGGPLIVADASSLAEWGGTKTSDYERACDDTRTAFVRKVFLSINHTGCSFALLPKGCLFVLEGADDAFPDKKGFRRVGAMQVSSGELVVFDATAAKAKTRERKTLAIPNGKYVVDELYRYEPFLWMVRFTRA